jgi:hypothetical protein
MAVRHKRNIPSHFWSRPVTRNEDTGVSKGDIVGGAD